MSSLFPDLKLCIYDSLLSRDLKYAKKEELNQLECRIRLLISVSLIQRWLEGKR